MPPENLQNTSQKNNKNTIVLIVIVICLVVVGYFFMKLPFFDFSKNTDSVEKVSVERFDSSSESVTKPSGLPDGLPLEESVEISESYSVVYEERGVTQHTFSYVSQKTPEEVFESFLSFMEDGGYEITYDGRDVGSLTISADKDDNNLFLSVNIRDGRVFVQISYLER